MGSSTQTVLAVIPAHNEAGRIGPVVTATRRHLPVLVVDDGSTDTTAEEARRHGAEVLSLSPNQGKGAALKAGLAWALREGARAVVTLDADGQHDPREIPAFLEVFGEHATEPALLIIGYRRFAQMPLQRTLTNGAARWIFSWAVGRRIPDNQSGYRLLSRPLVEDVLESKEKGFAFEVEVIARAIGRGWPIYWIPIRTIYSVGERSHIRPWTHLTSFVRVTLRARRTVAAVSRRHSTERGSQSR